MGIPYVVLAAYDNNAVANLVYQHNFGISPTTTNIEHISVFPQADLWLLSPPCQPYTRGGRLQDSLDPRAAALTHLTQCLLTMPVSALPQHLLLENVLNFEASQSRRHLVEVLATRGYELREFLLTPMDPWIRIPNDRLRYYLTATRASDTPRPAPLEADTHIVRSLVELLGAPPSGGQSPGGLLIGEYMEEAADPKYLVPEQFLAANRHYRHDVVRPDSTRSATFTKAYGSKHLIGTGSLVQTANLLTDHYRAGEYCPEALRRLRLRFFTPHEIARLHGFVLNAGHSDGGGERKRFSFPPGVSLQQQYRLLGNSLNVVVVAALLRHLLQQSPE